MICNYLLEMHPKSRSGKSVLVPIDFSSVSTTAVAQGIAMAANGARIILLHVVSQRSETLAERDRMMKAAQARLTDFSRTSERLSDRTIQCVVRIGPAFQEILTVAEEEKVKLIVVGVDASSSSSGVALGHTADRVSRYAHCPVLLVREAEAKKAR